jgi:hypothetical protein
MGNFFKGMPAYIYNLVSNPFRCFMRTFPHLGFLGAEFSPLCRGFDNNTVSGISVYTCTLYTVYAWALLYHSLSTFLNKAQPWSSVLPLIDRHRHS